MADLSLSGSRELISQTDAAITPRPSVPRSTFHNKKSRKGTYDAGYLYPIMVDELVPGDFVKYDFFPYVRMSTLLYPIMDGQKVDIHVFAVPPRLVWTNWKKFMGEQTNPGDSIAYTIPQLISPVLGHAVNSLQDHMGLPVVGQIAAAKTLSVSALPFRCYNLIYNEWFRDENLINSAYTYAVDGPDGDSYVLLKRAKQHDYFTSCLPFTQKGTAAYAPLVGQAAVAGLATNGLGIASPGGTIYDSYTPAGFAGSAYPAVNTANWNTNVFMRMAGVGQNYPLVFAELSTATGININSFRQAFLIQTLLENNAQGGTRYTEIIRKSFGVVSPDQRLQRPEFIGGGSVPVGVVPIAQTTPTGGNGLGALGGAGTASGRCSASFSATEHTYVIALMSIRTELSYQQGVHRMWDRSTRYDFFWPELNGLGEQSVTRREIYATGDVANDTTVFGYQERWHEYRTWYSDVVGLFRSTAAGTLDPWHLAQKFTSAPTLGQTFIEDTPPMSRILVLGGSSTGQQFIGDIAMERQITRPISLYGSPAQLGRF